MTIGIEIDHTEVLDADDPAVAVRVNEDIQRSASNGRVWVTWAQEAAGVVSFVEAAAAGAHSAFKTSASGTIAEVGGEPGLRWTADGIVGYLYSDVGPVSCRVTVSINPGR